MRGWQGAGDERAPGIQRVAGLVAQFEHFLALIRGDADAAAERDSLLKPHRVVGRILDAGRVLGAA